MKVNIQSPIPTSLFYYMNQFMNSHKYKYMPYYMFFLPVQTDIVILFHHCIFTGCRVCSCSVLLSGVLLVQFHFIIS